MQILAAVIRGIDIMEVYSPARVVQVCQKYNLAPGESLDLQTGWDLSRPSEQRRARELNRASCPRLLICSPPCTEFSRLQNLNLATQGDAWRKEFEAELEKAKEHVRFCTSLMREQMAAGRHFLFEHPAWATSWDMPELQALAFSPGVHWTRADQCMYGLTAATDDGEILASMKPTGFLSTAWCLIDELSLTCDKQHPHQPLMGGRAAGAAVCPPPLCHAISRGLARQIEYERTGLIGGKQFGRGEIKAMIKKLDKTNGDIEAIHKFNDADLGK